MQHPTLDPLALYLSTLQTLTRPEEGAAPLPPPERAFLEEGLTHLEKAITPQ